MLEIDDLTLAYGVNRVVRGFSLSVDQGEVCALLGPNGAGKTSILRAISGLMQPVEGQIDFEGSRCSSGRRTGSCWTESRTCPRGGASSRR